jgi:hypothetical protein
MAIKIKIKIENRMKNGIMYSFKLKISKIVISNN